MASNLDYAAARDLLDSAFRTAEAALLMKKPPKLGAAITRACAAVFASNTQAYREVLLGCTIARIQDTTVDITLPYVDMGSKAFSGRSLDENVVNPFLQSKRIPCSKGPYLSVFRRSVRFDLSTRPGLRDKVGYDAFLVGIRYAATCRDPVGFLTYQLYKFAELREEASIPLARLHRISLEQYGELLTSLLSTPSGGLFPVLLAVAAFNTIRFFYGVDWEVSWQGINVADAASGAGGDITIWRGQDVVLAVEVTERMVDKSRVVSTFNTKIAPAQIEDYLFLVGPSGTAADAKAQAQQYFAQGHEVNFVSIKEWILMSLATMGKGGRDSFNAELTDLLDSQPIPRALRVSWNDCISAVVSV